MINKIPYASFCPDCRKPIKPLFLQAKDHAAKSYQDHRCRCQKKKSGIGFDIKIYTRQIEINEENLVYIITTSSGTEQPNWQKDNLLCPFCSEFQFFVKNGDSGQNIKCKNPDCPALGFDFAKNSTHAYVTVSGMYNKTAEFLLNTYNNSEFALKIPLDRSNRTAKI